MITHCCNFEANLLGAEEAAVNLVGVFMFFDVEARIAVL
jgi:hypothetical protein